MSLRKRNNMPKLSPTLSLDRLLSELVKKRQEHLEALSQIEGVFKKYGIDPSRSKGAATSAGITAGTSDVPRGKARSKKRKFSQTADEFVLSLLLGGKSLTGSDLNAAWEAAGRAGRADNTLSLLVKNKKLKRTPLKEGRGSKYSVA
jgi:hypothetical protein